ncbi:hypothetical protein BDR03DRAFT_955516 [Suillus americanus]|nr:hypothetical protein BDR03DRAFT_955516 [Suillus americanus]
MLYLAFGLFFCPNALSMQISPIVDVAVCLSSVLLISILLMPIVRRCRSQCHSFFEPHDWCAKLMSDVLFIVFSDLVRNCGCTPNSTRVTQRNTQVTKRAAYRRGASCALKDRYLMVISRFCQCCNGLCP